MVDYARLLSVCTELIQSYEDATIGVEQHFQLFLSINKHQVSVLLCT